MTSRPGPGIQESLHSRGSSGPPRAQVRRRPSKPINNLQNAPQSDCIDPALEDPRRSAEEALTKSRAVGNIKTKPAPLEGIHTSSDATRPAPKGKPQLFFSNLATNTPEAPLQSPQTQPANVGSNLPIPPRPGAPRLGDNSQQHRMIPGGSGVKGNATLKGPGNDVPTPAITFPGGSKSGAAFPRYTSDNDLSETADLFPWTGNHPEDMLSEALVKGGISNKPQIMNETNTAQPSLWSNLKNKSGLSTLSTLFVAVLEKRQACGRLTAPNSFKPPPRLTLRDSTRETWLHDLANPAVGLRRLSRTIPHGITGKVLLEQCLNKNIPLPRAVWLAKCVGINEMRSHKRKGQAGTITWVRGWTSSVEQFLDSTIATIGQQEWKPRITYALQLATSLYKEHLLEDDHFLDWILKNLESCPPERLFLFLLVTSLFGPDLTASRRRGKRLAESLLNHAERLYQAEDGNQTSPLLGYLEKVLIKLLVTSPGCLLLPKMWKKNRSILQHLSSRHSHPQIVRTIENLEIRSKRLLQSSRNASTGNHDFSRKMYHLLDAIDYDQKIDIEGIAWKCMETIPETRNLVSTALDWASSLHREGSYRIYLVTRLLRKWSHVGIDIDDGILYYLQSMEPKTSSEPRNVFRVIAELARSRTFSVGKYLQWLIATGSLGSSEDLSVPSAWPLRLITEIPLTGLPEQVRNLRSTLLRSTPYSTEIEEQHLDDAESIVSQQLPSLFDLDMLQDQPAQLNMENLSSTVKLELAILLRQQVAATVQITEHVPTKDPSIEERGPVCTISPQDFHVVRSRLEDFDDLSILADVIGVISTSLDSNILASAADTLHYHHKAFCAIGAFEPLLGKIAMRYAAIRTVRFPERELLLSLADLSRMTQADSSFVQTLAYDLSRHEQKNSVAACSPVSDTMAEGIHNTAMDSDEEIDRILSSGTSMDQQIMTRVFGKIVLNLEEQINKGSFPSGNHAPWFYRLRSFDENAFESMMIDWVASLFTNHQSQMAHAALPPLVVSGCVTLKQVSEVASACAARREDNNQEEALRICLDTLDSVLPSGRLEPLCQPQEAYRYRVEQQKFCQGSGRHILQHLRRALEIGSKLPASPCQSQIRSLLSSESLRALVKHLAVNDVQGLSKSLGVGAETSVEITSHLTKALLDGLLDPTNRLGKYTLEVTFSSLLTLV